MNWFSFMAPQHPRKPRIMMTAPTKINIFTAIKGLRLASPGVKIWKWKRHLFYYRRLEYKSRKSRNTWSNRQIWSWSTEWSKAKANRILPRECTGHSKHPLQQHKRSLYTWTSPDGQQIDYVLCSLRRRSSIQSAKTKQNKTKQKYWELTVAQITNSLLPNSDLNGRQ